MKCDHKNGYSIAEILLVFGIIAGVLVGVWAMYTMLAEEADVKTAVAEILLIREAAVQFKTNNGGGKYHFVNIGTISAFKGYLGTLGDGLQNISQRGFEITNTFGDILTLRNVKSGMPIYQNIYVRSRGIPTLETCRRMLERFGEVEESSGNEYYIPAGKAISGYRGGPDFNHSGCFRNPKGIVIFRVVID